MIETEITRIFLYICTRKPSINCNMFRLEATWMWQYGHNTDQSSSPALVSYQ